MFVSCREEMLARQELDFGFFRLREQMSDLGVQSVLAVPQTLSFTALFCDGEHMQSIASSHLRRAHQVDSDATSNQWQFACGKTEGAEEKRTILGTTVAGMFLRKSVSHYLQHRAFMQQRNNLSVRTHTTHGVQRLYYCCSGWLACSTAVCATTATCSVLLCNHDFVSLIS